MHNPSTSAADQKSWKQLIVETRFTWLSATLLGGVVALVLGVASARYWEATQAVVVRQDAAASSERPGKFADLYEMRTVQETILELARSQQVVASTLAEVDGVDPTTLTADDLDELRSRVRMTPPGGAEFGKTELFYLSVEDTDRRRALRLVGKLCEQLDRRLRELRAEQARGLIAEIDGQLTAAKQTLADETSTLAQFEARVGADLGELRMLHSAWSGQSDLRQRYVDLGTDLRRAQQEVQEIEHLLALLESTADDPNQLAALPNSLLAAQPTLRRLKDGLVDAQLRTSRLQGARAAEHPRVVAAVEAEASMRRDLAQEVRSARHAAEAELQLRKSRRAAVAEQVRKMEQRLSDLAEQRAEYSNLVATSDSSLASVDELRSRLAEANALLAAAQTSSVLNLVDSPETGPAPNGPSRATMLLAGLLGGLTIGAGLVFYQQAPEVAYVATAEQSQPQGVSDVLRAPSARAEPPVVQEWWETPAARQSEANEIATANVEIEQGDADTSRVKADEAAVNDRRTGDVAENCSSETVRPEVSEVPLAQVRVADKQAAELETPEIETPEVEAPEVDVAEIEAPEIEAPEIDETEAEVAQAELEEAEVEEAEAGEVDFEDAEDADAHEEEAVVMAEQRVGAASSDVVGSAPSPAPARSSEPASATIPSRAKPGLPIPGLGSSDLNDAIRDAFLPSR